MNLKRILLIGSVCGPLLAGACGDDATEAVDTSNGTTTGTPMESDSAVTLTTTPTTTPTTDPTEAEATTGDDTTSGTMGDDDSTTDAVTTTGEETTGDETAGETTGGEAVYYKNCFPGGDEVCERDEVCLYGTMAGALEVSFCSASECNVAEDCPPQPGGGDAPTVCVPLGNGGENFCIISCDGGETCPDGMVCFGGACGHPSPWTCNPAYYEDGDCDCGCGLPDPDCADNTLASCEYCDLDGSCSDMDCPGNTQIDPDDNAVCL